LRGGSTKNRKKGGHDAKSGKDEKEGARSAIAWKSTAMKSFLAAHRERFSESGKGGSGDADGEISTSVLKTCQRA